jgi:hypothetical protein
LGIVGLMARILNPRHQDFKSAPSGFKSAPSGILNPRHQDFKPSGFQIRPSSSNSNAKSSFSS